MPSIQNTNKKQNQACKEAEKCEGKRNQSIQIDPQLTKMLYLADKLILKVTIIGVSGWLS